MASIEQPTQIEKPSVNPETSQLNEGGAEVAEPATRDASGL